MIIYGSSGIGSLGEILLLQQLCLREKTTGIYFLYTHSPDHQVRAVHNRFCLGSGQPSFKMSMAIIVDTLGLQCLELGSLFKNNGLWQITLGSLLEQIPGVDFNVLDRLHPKESIRKSAISRGLHQDLLQYTLDDLHRAGYTLGGRLIYWLVAKICQKNSNLFMAPAIRTNDVYAFFPESLLARTGYLHIRLAAPQPPEQGWEPLPPTVWPLLDRKIQDELLTVARWTVGQPEIRMDVLLEGDRKKVRAFYRNGGNPANI